MGSSLKTIMSQTSQMNKTLPVTFILGATGTGKSDLAVALAKRFSGEVINADAMQLYKGLDIVTNKVTSEECQGITHHMMDILHPDSLSYTIHNYRAQAKNHIDDIRERGKLPIIVGGTNYYVDSLMWDSLIPKHERTDDKQSSTRFECEPGEVTSQTLMFMCASARQGEDCPTMTSEQIRTQNREQLMDVVKRLDTNYLRVNIDSVDSPKLHMLLMAVDPDTAVTMHPNTARKVIRALEVLKHHGVSQQEFHTVINNKSGEHNFGAKLTYQNCLVLWLLCDQDVLNQRLDSRVDKMMKRGLIKELDKFHESHNLRLLQNDDVKRSHGDYTRGIFQCIGFKEFHEYLMLSDEDREEKKGIKLLEQGLQAMQTATRRYARYQNKWVKTQLFERRNPEYVPPVYSFDSSHKEMNAETVIEPATRLLEQVMRGETPTQTRHTIPGKPAVDNPIVHKTCATCNVTCVRQCEWDLHIKSKRHHKQVASLKRDTQRAYRMLSKTLQTHEENLVNELKNTESGDGNSYGDQVSDALAAHNNETDSQLNLLESDCVTQPQKIDAQPQIVIQSGSDTHKIVS